MPVFDFGKNWVSFSRKSLDSDRVNLARSDFKTLFADIPLSGRSFLDIGFGQGLSLFFAKEAGSVVTGCDINPKCLEALLETAKVIGTDPEFPIVIGSILSDEIIVKLKSFSEKSFDIVHSWGVLHHTGNMELAIKNACRLVASGGYLVLAIYNRHWTSPLWRIIKKTYCMLPRHIQSFMIWSMAPIIFLAKFLVTKRNPLNQQRGMEFMHNVIDWIGGYPYEYASVNEILRIMNSFGFSCAKVINTEVPTGCNQFVFRRI